MSADPQPDPTFEDDLVRAFARAAEGVRTEAEPLLTGGLTRGRNRRRRRTAAIVGSVAALTLVGAGGVLAAGLRAPVATSNALDDVKKNAPAHLDKSVNVLVMGLDSRKDMNGNDLPGSVVHDELQAGSSSDIGGYNTDTLIVLHIPAGGGKVTGVSIPRDDYVQTTGVDGKMDKIKDVYGHAKALAEIDLYRKGLSKADVEKQSREAGRTATLATVQNFLGIPIDHFAEVNLMGFYDIAQAVGPIQVCLNHDTKDPVMRGQGSGADFKAGLNTLNASQALAFVRQRHNLPGGDLDRTHRQQALIAAVTHQLKRDGVFDDLGKLQSLLDVVKKDVVVDDQWNLLDFAQQVPDLTGGNVEFNTLPIAGFQAVHGQGVNTVDPVLIKNIVQQLFGHDPAPAATPSGAGSADPTAAPTVTPDPAPTLPMQGAPVKAGGIPCVN